MYTRTYRASSMQEALELVRRDLGPDASVLHTREVSPGLLRWMMGRRHIEVTASTSFNVPSRFSADVGAKRQALPAQPAEIVRRNLRR